MVLLPSTLLLRTYSLTLLTCAYYLLTTPAKLLSFSPIWLLGESMSVRPAGYAPQSMPPDASSFGLLSAPGPGQGSSERELFALLGLVVWVYAATQFLFAADLSMPQGTRRAATSASSSSRAFGRGSSTSTSTSAAPKSSSRYAEELHTLLAAQSRWLTLAALHVLGSSTLVFWIYMFHSYSATEQPLPSTGSAGNRTSLLSGLRLLANRVVFTVGLADMMFWGYLWTVLKEEGREALTLLALRREADDDE